MPKPNPSFFKILIGDFASILHLPPLFAKIFGEKLSRNLTLVEISSGKSWDVKLENSDENYHYFFTDGWADFVTENELETGDFVVFWLMNNYSVFQVHLYGRTCCDKHLSPSSSSSLGYSNGFPGESDVNPKKLDMMKVKEEIMVEEDDEFEMEKESEIDDDEVVDDDEEDDEIMVGPTNNPSFVIILPASTDDEMIIPKGFVDKTGISGNRKILIKDRKGLEWKMNIISNGEGDLVMRGEWDVFRKENNLSKGYLCSFEVVGDYDDDKDDGSGNIDQLQFLLVKRSRGRPPGAKSKHRSI